MFLVAILKISFGRLRPDFIQICRPKVYACPEWYYLFESINPQKSSSYSGLESRAENLLDKDPRILDILMQKLAKKGIYFATQSTLQTGVNNQHFSNNFKDSNFELNEDFVTSGYYTNKDCQEYHILRLKDAR